MLKIKDKVNLKELEKYPFECQDSASIFWSNQDCSKYIRVWFLTREITCNDPNNKILKMMKKDGIVEKVRVMNNVITNNAYYCPAYK